MRGANRLPQRLFLVDVPMIATIPDIEFEAFGVPVDILNGKRNSRTHLETSRVMIPAARIIEIYSAGHKILMPNKDDLAGLYDILDKFLTDIIAANQQSINKIDVDERFVEEVDKFCMEMFSFNRITIIRRKLSNSQTSGYNIVPDLMSLRHAGHTSYQQQPQQPQHQSYSKRDVFDMVPDQPQDVTFIFNQSPTLNIDNIKRESMIKHLQQKKE